MPAPDQAQAQVERHLYIALDIRPIKNCPSLPIIDCVMAFVALVHGIGVSILCLPAVD